MSIPQALVVAVVIMQCGIFATTIYLHRGLARTERLLKARAQPA